MRVEVMNSADERKDHEPKNEHDLEAGKAREMTISEPQRKHGLANTLILLQ